jgi:hypothetical protein
MWSLAKRSLRYLNGGALSPFPSEPDQYDLPAMQNSDERIEGTHLPQEAKVEMPPMQPGQNADRQAAPLTI